jgi:uncharacterized surface protein with fasciclin (FAS1) repeats
MKQTTLLIIGGIILFVVIGYMVLISPKQSTSKSENTAPSQMTEKVEENPMMNKTIVDIASEDGNFGTLVAAVKAAGLVETLSGEGPYTVFAPTDEAFAKLPEGTVESLLQDKEKLTAILTYHVVAGKVMAADVENLTSAKTVQGQNVTIKVDGQTVMIDGAKVIKTDIEASNGVIHVIDSVILPK